MKRKASVVWRGSLSGGKGTISTESHALVNQQYSFGTRFDHQTGTNPEELIAAAHAGCFSMALSGELEKMKLTPTTIDTLATVTLEKVDNNWTISAVHLDVNAVVPGIDRSQFETAAESAKRHCPVSRLLKADISMNASLKG